jgi:choice-of-anchor A domain-containing protein
MATPDTFGSWNCEIRRTRVLSPILSTFVITPVARCTSIYQNLSTQLGGLASNGATLFDSNSGILSFNGGNGGLNVFSVSLQTLNASKGVDISATAGSTVLINVTGTGTASFSNGSVVESGVTGAAVLYNFVSASGVNLVGSKDPKGSILAADAAVTGGFGAMSGQLIAESYSGNTQFNDIEFTGTLPVPLPAGIWLFGSALLGAVRYLRGSWASAAAA